MFFGHLTAVSAPVVSAIRGRWPSRYGYSAHPVHVHNRTSTADSQQQSRHLARMAFIGVLIIASPFLQLYRKPLGQREKRRRPSAAPPIFSFDPKIREDIFSYLNTIFSYLFFNWLDSLQVATSRYKSLPFATVRYRSLPFAINASVFQFYMSL